MSVAGEAIRNEAHREAAELAVPYDELTDGACREVYSSDHPETVVRDDAMVASEEGDDRYILHVCTANVASYARVGSALQRNAHARFAANDRSIFPDAMLHKMGLFEGQTRPTLTVHIPIDKSGAGDADISQEFTRIERVVNHKELSGVLAEENGSGELTKLYRVATMLGSLSENTMVSTLTETAQDKAADYMDKHNIPGIFRLLTPRGGGRVEQSQLSDRPQPQGRHTVVRALITNPLREYTSYVNHANIVAHLEHKPFPFQPAHLQMIIEHMRKRPPLRPPTAGMVRSRLIDARRVHNEISPAVMPRPLLKVMAQALFSPLRGTDAEIRALRREAAHSTRDYSQHVSALIKVAKTEGWIQVISGPEPGSYTLVTCSRSEIPYSVTGDPVEDAAEAMRLVTKVANAQFVWQE